MTQDSRLPAAKRGTEIGDTTAGKVPSGFKRPHAPVTRVAGLALWLGVVGFGFVGALGYLAATSKMQSAVVAGGSFEIEGDLQVVDHLEGGILREIHVREGDDVEQGQALARLDGTRVEAQLGVFRSQLAAALSRQARLEAAVSQVATITFPIELQRLIEWDPSLEKVMKTQAALFASNRQSDLGEVQIFFERITQLRTRLNGLANEVATLLQQRAMVEAEIADLQTLFDKGLIQKGRLISRQEDLLEIEARVSQRATERQDALDQIAEIEERQLQIARDRRSEIAQEQQVLTENIFDLRQRIRSFEEVLTRLDIRAPISGRIVGFEANTIGSVIQPGEVLMQIVPKDAPFIVEAEIATSDVDQVFVGGDARVRLSAYSFRTTPPIEGEVTYVSADSFFNEADNQSFYRIHVQIEDDAYSVLPEAVSPQPGMPVQVMVATGEQTVLTYLLDPVLGGLETAMIESD